jgi:hypothetical protein
MRTRTQTPPKNEADRQARQSKARTTTKVVSVARLIERGRLPHPSLLFVPRQSNQFKKFVTMAQPANKKASLFQSMACGGAAASFAGT